MSNDINSFLFGGGGKAASFDQVGDVVKGVITDVQITQQTDMESGTPLTWDDGSPRQQLVITLQTDERLDDEDDGLRRVYAKGGKHEVAEGTGRSMKDAIAEAVKGAKASSISEGGTLQVGYTGIAKRKNRGYNPAKLYTAKYTAPVASVGADDLFD